ncbi:SCO family protein (plasmid) [Rhizobium sp. CC1099]|uniref:SCO family protein n=1 Tax=Rhizobium sp. CC1099 TaxID=3039160 RepID=UPI0024B26FAE|nr:SCO family protein [Rhizobium sp. CC1099]WFU89881.1 SCO family protein [Rhizobium sp. CC1099]
MDRPWKDHRASARQWLALAATMLAATAVVTAWPVRAVSETTVGGPFTLTASDGEAVTDATFRGKWLLVFFGYTFCPDSCPTTLSQIAVALEQLGADAQEVQPIFITVDPERDTPKAMGEYTEAIDKRIVGLSGTPEQIAAVSQAYGVYSERHRTGAGRDDYLIDHGTYIYIMSPEGKFARGMSADTPADDIAATLRHLMTDARNRG